MQLKNIGQGVAKDIEVNVEWDLNYKEYIENIISEFKKQLLLWVQQFEIAVWLDSNNYDQKYSNFDAILAVDPISKIETSYENAFSKLKKYQSE